jgi:hypothetical protein
MEKQLKDYIGYYMGCPCLNTWFPEGHAMRDNEWKLDGYREHTPKPYLLGNTEDETWTESIKPILRKISDVSEDEWYEIEDATSLIPDVKGYGYFQDAFLKDTLNDRYSWRITNEALVEMRKRGIDCDELISLGVAVDEKTLTK